MLRGEPRGLRARGEPAPTGASSWKVVVELGERKGQAKGREARPQRAGVSCQQRTERIRVRTGINGHEPRKGILKISLKAEKP